MLHQDGRYIGLERPTIRPLAVEKEEYWANTEQQARRNEKGIRQVDTGRGCVGHCGDKAINSLELSGRVEIRGFEHSADRFGAI